MSETEPEAGTTTAGRATTGKGRPTPKRSEAQRRRTGPVAPPPQTRREAAKRLREQQKESRRRGREGLERGDERYLLARDAGPVRKLVRDVVDSRRNVGVLVLPLAFLIVAAQATQNARVLAFATLLWLTGIALMALDVVVLSTLIRRRVRAAFPEEGKMGRHIGYGVLRSLALRRMRLPRPTVSPGRLRG